MGAKLGKSKSLPISEKVNGQEKEIVLDTNIHMDGTATLDKRIKKKKDKISSKKSYDIRVDKYTSTDGNVIPTSSASYIKQLVIASGSNHIAYDAQSNLTTHSETPSKDVQELRDACIRRGIISPETNSVTLPTSIEQENITNKIEETETPVVTNNESIQNEKQQQQEEEKQQQQEEEQQQQVDS